jgi:hypothetical protein
MISNVESSLYLSMPFIHDEMAEAIRELSQRNDPEKAKVDIHILVDFDAQTIRQGYGSFQALQKLMPLNIDLKNLSDNRVSFIIADDIGYFLFIESRSLIPADKATVNAVQIDPVTMTRIKFHFFPSVDQKEMQNELSNAIIEESQKLEYAGEIIQQDRSPAREISEKEYHSVKNDLKKSPPIHPDFKRKVNIYSTRFQYVEVRFKGKSFQQCWLTLPESLLPYKDNGLRQKLQTKLKLFDGLKETKAYKEYLQVREKEQQLLKEYTAPLRCRPNQRILKKEDKEQFKKEIENLNSELKTIGENLYGNMLSEMKDTEEELKSTLYDFWKNNPTEDMRHIGKENMDLMARDKADRAVKLIDFPKPYERWLKKLEIVVHYSDITYEDLGNENLLKELKEKGLIEKAEEVNLADFSKGIKYKEEQLK